MRLSQKARGPIGRCRMAILLASYHEPQLDTVGASSLLQEEKVLIAEPKTSTSPRGRRKLLRKGRQKSG